MYFLHLLYTRALDITAVHAKKKTALESGCHPFLSPEPIVFFGNVVNKAEWVGLGTRMGCHPAEIPLLHLSLAIDPSKPLFSLVPTEPALPIFFRDKSLVMSPSLLLSQPITNRVWNRCRSTVHDDSSVTLICMLIFDHYEILGNCSPSFLRTQHFSLSEKLELICMLIFEHYEILFSLSEKLVLT